MTLQEFEQLQLDIEEEKFPGGVLDPVHLGIECGKSEKEKLLRVIKLGANVRSKTVQRRVEGWKRQVKRLDTGIARLQKLKQEIEASRLKISASAKSQDPAGVHRRMRVE